MVQRFNIYYIFRDSGRQFYSSSILRTTLLNKIHWQNFMAKKRSQNPEFRQGHKRLFYLKPIPACTSTLLLGI